MEGNHVVMSLIDYEGLKEELRAAKATAAAAKAEALHQRKQVKQQLHDIIQVEKSFLGRLDVTLDLSKGLIREVIEEKVDAIEIEAGGPLFDRDVLKTPQDIIMDFHPKLEAAKLQAKAEEVDPWADNDRVLEAEEDGEDDEWQAALKRRLEPEGEEQE